VCVRARVHVCVRVCEDLPTCSSCYTTVVNTQLHWKFAAFLEECPWPAFWAFFSPVSGFYFGTFVQVHMGSSCLCLQVRAGSIGMRGRLAVSARALSRGGWFQVSLEISLLAMCSWWLWLSFPF